MIWLRDTDTTVKSKRRGNGVLQHWDLAGGLYTFDWVQKVGKTPHPHYLFHGGVEEGPRF
jgi:hypothetical protein